MTTTAEMTIIAEVLHTITDHLPLPTGYDRQQLHDAIASATDTQPAAEPPLDMTKSEPAPPATTAYGPGVLPAIQGGPYAAPLSPEATAALLGQGQVG